MSADPAARPGPIDIGTVERPEEEPAADAPRPRRRLRLIILIALLTVAVAGAAVLGYTAWQISAEKDAKLTTPATVGTLTLDESENAKSTAEYLQTAVAAEIDLDETIGAVYQDAGDKNVLFFGGTALFWTPENDLDKAFDLIADNEGAVTDLHKVEAGPLGGTMKCGTTKSDTGNLTVCGWADHGSLALAMFNNRSEQEAAPLLRQLRDAAESR